MGENNLQRCQEEADEVTEIMLENYNKVMEREGKLSNLDARAEELRNEGAVFCKTSRNLAWKKRWEKQKWKIILGSVVGGFLTIIILVLVLYFTLSTSTPAALGGN